MPSRHRSLPIASIVLLVLVAASLPAAARAQSAESPLIAEARAFMGGYGEDLRAGDGEAIAARYDRRGAYIMFDGERDFAPWDALAAQYRTGWEPPAAFEWQGMIYEPAGADAVVVNGHFLWTMRPGEAPIRFRYTGLLVREDGELRIRLEDESAIPGAPPAP